MSTTLMHPKDTELKQFIDQKVLELSAKWESSIVMPALIDSVYIEECDILQFVNDDMYYGPDSHRVVRFSLKDYPIAGGFNGDGFKKLCCHVMKASINNGFKIAKNGTYKLKALNILTKKFSCTRSFIYRGNTSNHPWSF